MRLVFNNIGGSWHLLSSCSFKLKELHSSFWQTGCLKTRQSWFGVCTLLGDGGARSQAANLYKTE